MKLSFCLMALVSAEKMTTQVEESSNMALVTNRYARDQACLPAGQCLNPYCSLYDCYEKNNKPLCSGESLNKANTPTEAKVGIHHNIAIGYLSGWTTKLNVKYSAQHANNDMRVIISNWNTANLWMFVAAQHNNDINKDYYIGAFAPTKRVFSRCNNSRHSGYRTLGSSDCIHGAYWYCVLDWSFGFTAHNTVKLQQADTYGVWNNHNQGAHNHRLSWHMLAWYKAGWRAGGAHNMNGESSMWKVVKTKQCNSCGVTPTKSPTNHPTAHPTNYPTAHPTNYPTAQPTNYPTAHPTNYPTAHPTNFPTPSPTGILSHATCAVTTCTYTMVNGKAMTLVNTQRGVEKWHCEKAGNSCKCVCDSSLTCALRHHHETGYKKTIEHCAAGAATPAPTPDNTENFKLGYVSEWCGKVSQHKNAPQLDDSGVMRSGVWTTDPGGVTGCSTTSTHGWWAISANAANRKIHQYCKKFWPEANYASGAGSSSTISWCESGNKNCKTYQNGGKTTYKCAKLAPWRLAQAHYQANNQ